jgi:hypothetical protein
MKYWNELIAIEEQSIRLDCLKSLVNVVANGCEGSTREEITNSLWHITGALEDINEKLKDAFSTCFDAVRNDDIDGIDYEDEEAEDDALVNTEYKFDELQSVVNSWARNNKQ